jgi:hypothetical protein
MRRPYFSGAWQPIETAPMGVDLFLRVADRDGAYNLPFLCKLTQAGWTSSLTGALLTVRPTHWQPPQSPASVL